MHAVLLLAALATGRPGHPGVELLADSIANVVALSDSLALCSDLSGRFFTISLPSGERAGWASSWQPADDGWELREGASWDGNIFVLNMSPNRRHLVYAQGVRLPERYQLPRDREGMRGCFVVVLCNPDGSGAHPVALGVEVGGGPDYDFTSDSRRLVGQPFYACLPTPAAYADFVHRDWDDPSVSPFDFIDVETGERGVIPGLDVSDGYWKCPWSDYFRIENNWYEEHDFSSFATGGTVGRYSVPEGSEGFIRGWVLPDAVLMAGPTRWRVVFVDGRAVDGPPMTWDLYCRLPDGSYLYSTDEGRHVLHGLVDWTTGEVGEAVQCPGLEDFQDATFLPLPGSGGVLLHTSPLSDTGRLSYFELPR